MDKSYIDFILGYRNNIRLAIEDKRADMNTRKVGGDGTGHCRISDPTAEQALRNIELIGTVEVFYGPSVNGVRESRFVYDSERWLRVSDETWNFYRMLKNRKYYQLMQLRYMDGLKGRELEKAAWKTAHIGRRRCYYMQMSIRNHAYKLGKSLGLRGADQRRIHPRTEEILRMFKETGK